jgi:hypothetical protein
LARLTGALVDSSPWLVLGVAYFLFRLWIFGDPFRFYPGASPLHTLVTGEWLSSLFSIGDWWSVAAPEPSSRAVFDICLALLSFVACAAALRERSLRPALFALAVALLGAMALLLAHWHWVANGEGGRVLYPIWAIAALLLILPLAASGSLLRTTARVLVVGLIASEASLARAAIGRWIDAGRDMRTLIGAVAQVAVDVRPSGYAFIVVPDHVGPIPFARNGHGGLLLPPTQQRSLSPWLMVQTPEELDRWPDLFARDVIGRLRREPIEAVAANLLTPRVSAPHALPDRYYCWSPRAHALMPLALAFATDLSDWSVRWRQALPAAGCIGEAPG